MQTKTEMGGLASSIASFKQKFGSEPPSNITLSETGTWTGSSDLVASLIKLRTIWPQFNSALTYDFNLDGDANDVISLSGPECLVFFLGGPTTFVDADSDRLYDSNENVVQVNGFSKNAADPFGPMASGTATREGPFYTSFTLDRLISNPSNTYIYSFADPFPGTQKPYLYASSNDGQGYREDASGNALDFGTAPAAMTYYYRQGAETSAAPFTSPFWNKNSFQIISAGADRKYGIGGPYQKGELAIPSGQSATYRDDERDNITNFSDGVLVP
ncbi:MAG: hypothetical protein U0872_12270 [Planctomycetaceae bacterium]